MLRRVSRDTTNEIGSPRTSIVDTRERTVDMSTTATATATVAALEERVREGDTTVTADDIERARQQERFAALQGEAAQRAAVRKRQAERQRQLDELCDELGARGDGSPALTELADTARTALDALLDALDEHNAFVRSTAQQMRVLHASKLQKMDPGGIGYESGYGETVVAAGGTTWRARYNIAAVALAVLYEALHARQLPMPTNHPGAYGTVAQQLANLVGSTGSAR